jgi:ABC-type multidrug transport system fused ATPase/permease subunit
MLNPGNVQLGMCHSKFFLADDTIASNIAFGLETKDVNQDAVRKSF